MVLWFVFVLFIYLHKLNFVGKVFVHCYKGVSRSATIVIAYLMLKCNIDLEDAVKMIRAKRKIHPNDGFIRQLCILSRQLYGAKFE